jgi:alpha-D-ribose 1-methylphosphonate 5-triphosphate synthase subunit PhnH
MTGTLDIARLEPGFGDPVRGAQGCFRAVLDAMAHPGRIVALPTSLGGAPPEPLGAATTAVVLALCDIDTPLWLDAKAVPTAGYFAFHCGAAVAEGPAEARFAVIADAANLPPLDRFALGSDEYPERAATLAIQVANLAEEAGVTLRGPGIRGEAALAVAGLPSRFWTERATLAALFPRGVDVVFVCGDRLVALPRSTQAVL